ncbi:MAG TPA: hypothetical protein PKI93_05220 [Alphaproteobacteria bacterium]|nr:hypothetical protein [Alphaproteobacteria bacterium]HNS44657.1 hypothetical protein [Alphaproteobacteria bacterium]
MPIPELTEAFSTSGNLLPSSKDMELRFSDSEIQTAKARMMDSEVRVGLNNILADPGLADPINLFSIKRLLVQIGKSDQWFMKQFILDDATLGNTLLRKHPKLLGNLYECLFPEGRVDYILDRLKKNAFFFGRYATFETEKRGLLLKVMNWFGQSARCYDLLETRLSNGETLRATLKLWQKQMKPQQPMDWLDGWPQPAPFPEQMAAQTGPSSPQMGGSPQSGQSG